MVILQDLNYPIDFMNCAYFSKGKIQGICVIRVISHFT